MKKVLIFVILLGGGLWFYGRSLPREHEVKSTLTLVAPLDTVYRVVRSIGSTPEWWSDMKSVRPLTGRRYESWEQNMGGGMGLVSIAVTSAIPGQRMVTEIIPNEGQPDESQKWGGVWTYRIRQTAAGTEVQITEEGWVDPPFFRIMMKLRGRYRTIDSYLSSLGAHFDEASRPRHGN